MSFLLSFLLVTSAHLPGRANGDGGLCSRSSRELPLMLVWLYRAKNGTLRSHSVTAGVHVAVAAQAPVMLSSRGSQKLRPSWLSGHSKPAANFDLAEETSSQ